MKYKILPGMITDAINAHPDGVKELADLARRPVRSRTDRPGQMEKQFSLISQGTLSYCTRFI